MITWPAGQPAVYVVQVVAFVLLAAAWWGTSGTGVLERQVDWLLVAIVALGVSLASCLGWLYVGRRRIALRRARLGAQVRAKFDAQPVPADAVRAELVAAESMTRYHRAGCQLAREKDARPSSREAHVYAGRTPCGVCRP